MSSSSRCEQSKLYTRRLSEASCITAYVLCKRPYLSLFRQICRIGSLDSLFRGLTRNTLCSGLFTLLFRQVIVVPLRVNVNLKACTVEEKEAQRKVLPTHS